MPKLKDFLRKIVDQAAIKDTDFEAVLSASTLAELEITEDFEKKFHNVYLTRDRAENDPEIIKKLNLKSKSEVLDTVDEGLKKLLDRIPKEKLTEIEKEKSTFKRIELINDALGEVLTNTKSTTEKDIQKIEKEWAEKNKAIVEAHKHELKKVLDDAQNDKLNFALKNKIFSYTFSDAYTGMKNATADILINQLRGSQHNGTPVVLELDPSGAINVRQETEGGLRDIYSNGNEKLTIDNLLDPLVQPFVKKADTAPNGGGATHKPITPPADRSKMTIHEMMKADAALNGQ
jgi:hypothetical protein